MKRLSYAVSATTLASALSLAVAYSDDRDLPTVDGPETAGLVDRLKGLLVYPEPVGGILATGLPSLNKKTVRPPGKGPAVSDLSEPVRGGRIAVVESVPLGAVSLRILRVDGSESKDVVRRRDRVRSRAIGRPALSPDGETVAFVSNTQSLYMKVEPKTTFREGTLEVWQVDEPRRLELDVRAIDRSLAWFSDRNDLLYSALVGPETLPRELIGEYSVAIGSGLIPLVERKFPVVHRLERPGKETVPLCIGRRSVVAQDGKSILVQGIGFEWMLYDFETRRLRRVELPGLYDRDRLGIYEGGAIALLKGDFVIYWGLPTKGAIQRKTTNNSPLVGPKSMPSIKVARLSSGEFQTVIPFMDPRSEVLFGQVEASK